MPLGETICTSWKHLMSQKEITLPLELTGSILTIKLRWHEIQRKYVGQRVPRGLSKPDFARLVSRRGNSHIYHYHQALSVVSSKKLLYLELYIGLAKISQPRLGWWSWMSLTIFRVKKHQTKQTRPPQKAFSSKHSIKPQLPMLKRELPLQ